MRKLTKDEELLNMVRMAPCCVCFLKGPSDPHHLKTRGSGGKNDNWNLLALCRGHHVQIHKVGQSKFIEIHPIMKDILIMKNWEFDEIRKKWFYPEHENNTDNL